MMDKPVRIFISYSHNDKDLKDELLTHLALLVRQGKIAPWHDSEIPVGSDWATVIDYNLRESDILLLLISASFIASDYCYGEELGIALERQQAGEAIVIPIILKPCDWHSAPFGKLQGLPRDGVTVIDNLSRDTMWAQIAIEIRSAIDKYVKSSR